MNVTVLTFFGFKLQDEVKNVIGKVCKKLPDAVQGTCHEFLNTYGDAVVALLAEAIDPSEVSISVSKQYE